VSRQRSVVRTSQGEDRWSEPMADGRHSISWQWAGDVGHRLVK
jgi:hypothetical protein